jgi:hypothetical protein
MSKENTEILSDRNQSDADSRKQVAGIKTTTVLSAMFGIILTCIGAINFLQNQRAHDDTMSAVKDLKVEMLNTYVSKMDFQTALASINSTQAKLWEKESANSDALNKTTYEINLKLQHIEDSMSKNP